MARPAAAALAQRCAAAAAGGAAQPSLALAAAVASAPERLAAALLGGLRGGVGADAVAPSSAHAFAPLDAAGLDAAPHAPPRPWGEPDAGPGRCPAPGLCDPCGCGGWAQARTHDRGQGEAASGPRAKGGSGGGGGGGGGKGAAPSSPSSASAAAAAAGADPLAAALAGGSARARHLTPREIVARLDDYIVGQQDAKRAVAVALRNRWRRHQLDPAAAREVVPRNILMVGPTGCGKTEIARRLARLVDAPFVKVEATKFTELGYVGRDVDEIVKDLVEASMGLTRARLKAALSERAAAGAEERILRDLCGELSDKGVFETFRQLYREGALDDRTVEVTLSPPGSGPEAGILQTFERLGLVPPRGAAGGGGGGRRGGGAGQKQKMKVRDARQLLVDQEAERWLSSELVAREAVRAAQEDGIVFIDEIDKIAVKGGVGTGGSVSSEGVQRDLLPILEGSVVSTKHGPVSTDHVLFICSGAFHSAKPSDMLAELQGRLPVRVELKGLSAGDFYRILTEPAHSMIRQQQALLATEGVELAFTDKAVRAIASAAEEANRLLDNIGARRLHTVLERVLADISFSAPERAAAAAAGTADAPQQPPPQPGQQQHQQQHSVGAAAAEGPDPPQAQQQQQQQQPRQQRAPNGGDGAPLVRYEVTEADVRSAVGELLKKVDLSKYML